MKKSDRLLQEAIKIVEKKKGYSISKKEAKMAIRAEQREQDRKYKEKHGKTRQQAYMERLRQKAENGDMEAQEKLNRIMESKRRATKEWKRRNPDKVKIYGLVAILSKHIPKEHTLFGNSEQETIQREELQQEELQQDTFHDTGAPAEVSLDRAE